MRLLLVEDEKELADALMAALSKQGIVIDHAMLLADAGELIRQNTYDVILLDRRLPDGEGLTFIPTLRRVRAVLRRPASVVEALIVVGRMTIDPLNLTVTMDKSPFDLPRRELLVLIALAKRQGKTVLRSVLEAAVYNYEEEIQSNALDAHISRLRKRLADCSAGVSVHNIRGVGYLLKDEV
jgi:DNA-binding response OmpR family regulator